MDKHLFLDIETVSVHQHWTQLPPEWMELWSKKMRNETMPESDLYTTQAGLYAEFSKIICISVGFVRNGEIRIKTFAGEEKTLLEEFAKLLGESKFDFLVAHNGKGFDFPFICKRMILHKIKIPKLLNIIGKKPWEIPLIDTHEIWQFGNYKGGASLDLLCHFFGVKSSKGEMGGDKVHGAYYAGEINKIMEYCEDDVEALIKVYCKIFDIPLPIRNKELNL